MVKKILLCVVLCALGVVLIVVSGKLKAKLSDPSLVKVQATISNIEIEGAGDDTNHIVYVDYELDGTVKRAQLNYYSSSMKIGNAMEVLVDKGNPTYVYANSKTPSRIVLAAGIASLIAGVLCLFSRTRRRIMI